MKHMPDNGKETCKAARTEQGRHHDYEDCEKLKTLVSGGKYLLDCGHHVTLNHSFGNNIAIINGKDLRIICTLCLY